MTDILLRGGRVIDPARDADGSADVLLQGGKIAAVGGSLAAPAGAQVVDCKGRWVVPGLIDMHTHLREPGQEYKENIETGTRAAAAGGFTAVCAMPNTVPPNDNRAVTELMVRRAREVGVVRVYPIGCITAGQKGETLAEMGEMQEAGIVAVSDDGKGVMNSEVMRRALEYARGLGLLVIQHAEDCSLSANGPAHEGAVSTRIGLRGQPSAAESTMVARDLELVALTGARYHVAHASCAETVRLVRDAKRRGLPVTAEVTPHHLFLTDEACAGYDTSTRVNPPLRGQSDVEAMRAALADGTMDAVATDHAPHSPVEKDVEFELASPGIIGLETALALCLELVAAGLLSPSALVARMSTAPAKILGVPGGTLAPGSLADVTVIDPQVAWTCEPAKLQSRSRNTPFAGRVMHGRAMLTIVAGTIAFAEEKLVG
jgi:dihydroorotase